MKENDILKLIFLHIGIGILISFFPFIAKIYAVSIIVAGSYFVIKNSNQDNEILHVIAYIVGAEVFLRTTSGSISYEYGKYLMLFFTALGLFYSGIPKKKNPYWIYLLLIIPGIVMPLDLFTAGFRERISFDILGPVCLGVFALYTYKRKISADELKNILAIILLPVIASCVFLLSHFPYHDGVVNNTESNFFLSGGFAPNQMATILGLGVFVFFLRILLVPTSKKFLIISLILFGYVYYRSLMTFSRGGMATGFAIILILLFSIFISKEKLKPIKKRLVVLLIIFPTIFLLGSIQTESLLFRRYANENTNGLPKGYETNGREDMAREEIKIFEEHPTLGVGVGKTKEIREVKYGSKILTHSEITRLLAEHGILGILSIIILVTFPVLMYLKNRQNIYLLPLFCFWLLTINHSGMRIAAPAFIYGLALLNLQLKPDESSSA